MRIFSQLESLVCNFLDDIARRLSGVGKDTVKFKLVDVCDQIGLTKEQAKIIDKQTWEKGYSVKDIYQTRMCLAQIFASGRLSREDVNSIAHYTPEFYMHIAKKQGITGKELFEKLTTTFTIEGFKQALTA